MLVSMEDQVVLVVYWPFRDVNWAFLAFYSMMAVDVVVKPGVTQAEIVVE